MPTEIYLLKVGMTMTEGMVSEWYVADGDAVAQGDPLYALETEKINMDVDAEVSGIVKHLVQPGVTMEPGDIVGYIYQSGEQLPNDMKEVQVQAPPAASEPVSTNSLKSPGRSDRVIS